MAYRLPLDEFQLPGQLGNCQAISYTCPDLYAIFFLTSDKAKLVLTLHRIEKIRCQGFFFFFAFLKVKVLYLVLSKYTKITCSSNS